MSFIVSETSRDIQLQSLSFLIKVEWIHSKSILTQNIWSTIYSSISFIWSDPVLIVVFFKFKHASVCFCSVIRSWTIMSGQTQHCKKQWKIFHLYPRTRCQIHNVHLWHSQECHVGYWENESRFREKAESRDWHCWGLMSQLICGSNTYSIGINTVVIWFGYPFVVKTQRIIFISSLAYTLWYNPLFVTWRLSQLWCATPPSSSRLTHVSATLTVDACQTGHYHVIQRGGGTLS